MRHLECFLQLRIIKTRAQAAGSEQWQADLRLEQPRAAAAVEQPGEFAAGTAGAGSQANAREEGGARCSDIRVGRAQTVLGLENIGPPLQQVVGQPGG